MQKYKQIKNRALLNFLKNNQICAIKKELKKYNRDIDMISDSQKIEIKKRNIQS